MPERETGETGGYRARGAAPAQRAEGAEARPGPARGSTEQERRFSTSSGPLPPTTPLEFASSLTSAATCVHTRKDI